MAMAALILLHSALSNAASVALAHISVLPDMVPQPISAVVDRLRRGRKPIMAVALPWGSTAMAVAWWEGQLNHPGKSPGDMMEELWRDEELDHPASNERWWSMATVRGDGLSVRLSRDELRRWFDEYQLPLLAMRMDTGNEAVLTARANTGGRATGWIGWTRPPDE
jgi:hypothetical protein